MKDVLKQTGHGRVTAFSNLRKRGIMEFNKHMGKDGFEMMRERQPSPKKKDEQTVQSRQKEVVKMCSKYLGVFDRQYIWRHMKMCNGSGNGIPSTMDVACVSLGEQQGKREIENAGFGKEVLGKIRLAKADRVIVRLGLYYYRKVARGNYHLVVTHMRRLELLLMNVRTVCANVSLAGETLIDRNFFNLSWKLLIVCALCTTNGNTDKSNLRLALGYLRKKAATVMEGAYLICRDDSKQRETELLLRTLKSNWDQYFGPAVLACETRQQQKLRKPAELQRE
jgi:hypothetical protein